MLENYQRLLKTKDGVSILMRRIDSSDEQMLKDFLVRIPEQERWFLRDDTTDPNATNEWIRNLDYDKVLPLVAVNTLTPKRIR
ncbi:MAG: hypothetical protein M1511_10645, partial [Deltaproteobacteria bacterium]|nr:hypothetical protein [Deltaproteobacteria bacterium]